MSKKKVDSKIQILNVGMSSASRSEVLAILGKILGAKRKQSPFLVVTPNSEQVVQAQTNDVLRSILNESDLSLPDGIGIPLSWRFLKFRAKSQKLREIGLKRIAGVDLMMDLVKLAAEKGYKVFLLGGRAPDGARLGVAQAAAEKLKEMYPGLQIRAFSGPRDVSRETREELGESLARINGFETDILLVGFGAPKQEKWVWQNKDKLRVKVAMVVGGAFDMVCGNIPRAPKWLRTIGFEWLWRLVHEPWRWKRQLRLFKFWWLVSQELFARQGCNPVR